MHLIVHIMYFDLTLAENFDRTFCPKRSLDLASLYLLFSLVVFGVLGCILGGGKTSVPSNVLTTNMQRGRPCRP